MSDDLCLYCDHVRIGYNDSINDLPAVFTIPNGSYTCIIGGNGAGKSTLLRTLIGLQKPLSGAVERHFDRVGYLAQETDIQKDFPASVMEVVLSGCKRRLMPFYSAAEKADAEEVLRKVGMYELRKSSYQQLSGGQKQRVLLARTVLSSPEFITLDEPVAGLDESVTKDMYDLLRESNKRGTTIIMVTHNLRDVIKDCSHIINIEDSHIRSLAKEDYLKEVGEYSVE